MQYLNTNTSNYNRVYTDLIFSCHGLLTRWHFYAWQSGSIYLDVYRPNGDNSFTLMAKTLVTAGGAGVNSHSLLKEDWIEIQPGFVIGYHSQDASANGVITEDNFTTPLQYYHSLQLSDVYFTFDNIYDASLPVGGNYTPDTVRHKQALPAINTDISMMDFSFQLSFLPILIICLLL